MLVYGMNRGCVCCTAHDEESGESSNYTLLVMVLVLLVLAIGLRHVGDMMRGAIAVGLFWGIE